MDQPHLLRLVGLYRSRAAAAHARDQLQSQGFAPQQIRLLEPGAWLDGAPDKDDVRKDLMREGVIDTAIGSPSGDGVAVSLPMARLTLFISNQVLGSLYEIGWGASLGGVMNGVAGAERSREHVTQLINDALSAGQAVLVVYANTDQEAARVQHVISHQTDTASRRMRKGSHLHRTDAMVH